MNENPNNLKGFDMVYCDPARREISEESREFMRLRRQSPAFGFNDFTLPDVREIMGARVEPADMAFHNRPAVLNGIPGEWVWADGADPDLRLLYIHGGGYISGSPGFYIALATRLSQSAGCVVFLPDYRLAPEYPFPCAMEDCVSAYEGLREYSPEGECPARGIFISGDSAGGGLVLASLLRLRDNGRPMPTGAIPISPFSDLTLTAVSIQSEAELDPIMHPGCLPHFVKYYTGEADVKNPLVSPSLGDYHGFPPLLIQVGEHEVIRDDSVQAAARAHEAGVPVTLEIWGGMFHVFQGREPALPESLKAIEHIAEFMRSCLSSEIEAEGTL
jgi:acetyl esterase/lipase